MDPIVGCVHILRGGERGGEPCGENIFIDGEDFCQKHIRLEEFNKALGTCKEKLLTGPRSGCYCTKNAVHDGYCESHARLTEPTDATCTHKMARGARKGYYCTEDRYCDDLCYTHYMNLAAFDAPDQNGIITCKYQFVKGKNVDKYCPRPISEGDECRYHQGMIEAHKERAAARKEREPRTPCVYVLTKGVRMGDVCGKGAVATIDGENRCRQHSKQGKEDKEPRSPCTYILSKGPNKGNECGKGAVVVSNGEDRCRQHQNVKVAIPQKVKKTKKAHCGAEIVTEKYKCKRAGTYNGYCKQHREDSVEDGVTKRRCQHEIIKHGKCKLKATRDDGRCHLHTEVKEEDSE